ncbi:aspartate aminotransferase family protein [Pseudalkalibacillus decolorationis]|uniref:aminotransferase family protein n=1 Tax=Pseudalkalibacillus decolorationis TaxID=163879 RepID=UPI0021496F39|nr:aspartate aminotransferase family protein [Pseudalkalibacillus decolorationis]
MKEQFVEKTNHPDYLKKLDKAHYFHPTTPLKLHQQNGPGLIIKKGKGINVTDVYDDVYIDGVSSLWNVNIGYGRQEMAEAAKQQIMRLSYGSSFYNNSNDKVIQLSEKLAELTPGDLDVSFFTSGGSESNETAFKIVRHYWKLKGKPERTKIIALDLSYHGVTMGATSATGVREFDNMITSSAPGFLHAKPFLTACEKGDKSQPDYESSIRGIVEKEDPETVAAVILEPIQGVGGVNIPPEGYLKAVRELCDEYGIYMVADEVICGFGRTGKMFGVDNWEVVPDLMSVAKGITSGYMQLGAVLLKTELRDELAEMSDDVFFHGFTYSGHPTACAVALKNLEIIENEQLVNNSKNMGDELFKGLKYLEEQHQVTAKSRTSGLLGAIELFADRDNGKAFDPSLHAAQQVVEECLSRNLLLRPLSFGGMNAVALAPPLIVNKGDIETIVERLSDAIKAFENKAL